MLQLTIEEFIEYLELKVEQSKLSARTIPTYTSHARGYIDWLDGRFFSQELAQSYIDYLKKEGRSSSTVSTAAYAVKLYHKVSGSTIEIDRPPVSIPEPKYLEEKEIKMLLDNCSTSFERVLLTVLYDSGMRISELLSIKTDDIDRTLGLITVTRKGGRRDRVNVSQQSIDALDTWLEYRSYDSKEVFKTDYRSSLKVLKNLGLKVGIKVTPHMLRHSRAVQMLISGAEPYVVQQHLGHKSLATTMDIYGKMKPVQLREKIPAMFSS